MLKLLKKGAVHLLVVSTRGIKRTVMATSPYPLKKVKLLLKTFPNIWRRIIRTSPPYKLRYKSIKRKNLTYQTQMNSHTHIYFILKENYQGLDPRYNTYKKTLLL